VETHVIYKSVFFLQQSLENSPAVTLDIDPAEILSPLEKESTKG